ncbi:PAAR-like domain-containing protein [Neoroseomonas oryzicola]|uniref:DUF4150 domain-containing protein n=1 Tax=Neoroseomonas oryzicola TaxID=535904 RepID=A0A9X9WMK6_9PROT|nr:PAAR-like domain-containing protein [Neoroseomonas oryzicola]MBR0661566.1 DUF4150 domain-containing protein [Neoroseomonas oryzicola]NKE16940.1 DUF4150 domain-containing protein [Neoroseomonas oryzicola]
MANEVYANGREIACKAAAGKTVAAFPDVCLSPPSPPAGPVPLPYPNTAYASDTTNGSTTVQISGKEIMLKDKSVFKTSTGNEAATKSLGMGVVTHTIQGEASFTMWSMDVKVEGANVDRHLDMTMHNEQCQPANTPPWPYVDAMAVANDPCATEKAAEQTACGPHGGDRAKECADAACQTAQACKLVPYGRSGSPNCCPGKTGHHLVEVNNFTEPGGREGLGNVLGMSAKSFTSTIGPAFWQEGTFSKPIALPGLGDYNQDAAPTVCADTAVGYTDHGAMHAVTEREKRRFRGAPVLHVFGKDASGKDITSRWTYNDASNAGAKALNTVHPQCTEKCAKAQLDAYHTGPAKMAKDEPIRLDESQHYPEGSRWLRDNRG